ncbi:MAG: hypothetical protein IPK58_24110 [Acidobacteria bacterium]|nr:hypothetical protein [Acidobacteriota bacterium]
MCRAYVERRFQENRILIGDRQAAGRITATVETVFEFVRSGVAVVIGVAWGVSFGQIFRYVDLDLRARDGDRKN